MQPAAHARVFQAKALKVLLATAALGCQLLPAVSSDWVEGDAVMYREPVRRAPVVREDPPQHSSAEEGAVSVHDPGAPGSAPNQHFQGHTLEGNVTRASVNPPAADLTMQTPVRFTPPQVKVVNPKVFQAWLQSTHPDLGIHPRNEVLNIKGQWDDSAHALRSFGIAYMKVAPSKLTDGSLQGTKLIVVDCAGNLQPAELEAVGKFVREGGYLLTTDWALDGCLVRAIPGYVMWNGGYTESEVVDAHVVGDDEQLLKGTVPRAFWKLDNKSETVRVLKHSAVQVLVKSHMLMREDPDQQGILALTFNYGKGKVLHLVGHFDNNADRAFNNALPDPAPTMGISLRQGIAANFIAEALKRGQSEPSRTGDLPVKKGFGVVE